MQKISTCLWFDNEAEEAVKFYTSIFKKSKIGKVMRYDKASSKVSGRPEGSVLTVEFKIEGMEFTALNGGPVFKFNEAISLIVNCKNQKELDEYWNKLTADGGMEVECGWLKDKYGLSWQIVPEGIGELVGGKDIEGSKRAMEAMLKMKKLDMAKLDAAYKGK